MTVLRLVVLSVLQSILLSACDTPSDLPHLQDEALAMTRGYDARLDELSRRVELIRRRGSDLPAEVLSTGNTGRLFRHALTRIEEYRAFLQRLPTSVQGDVKTGDRNKVLQRLDAARAELRHAVSEVTSDLAAVESAIANAERHGPSQVPPDDPDAAPIR